MVSDDGDEPTLDFGPELVFDMQDVLLREAKAGRQPLNVDTLYRNIVVERGLPRVGALDPGNRLGSRDTTAIGIALAEAVHALIGLGLFVPATDRWHSSISTTFSYSTPGGSKTVDATHLAIGCPMDIRLSTVGHNLMDEGTVVTRNPDLYLRNLPSVGSRVRECLREALNAYRRGLPLATVILLGAASEAAWGEVGADTARRLGDSALEATVVDEDVSIAKRQQALMSAVRAHLGRSAVGRVRNATDMHPDRLEWLGQFFAELRNYAVHRSTPPVPIEMTMAGTLVYQGHTYFSALYRLPDAI